MSMLPMEACEWRVGPAGLGEVRIVDRVQRDGLVLFAVKHLSYVANRKREWELEPIPSSRDDDFLLRCRFADWEEAALLAQHMAKYEVDS